MTINGVNGNSAYQAIASGEKINNTATEEMNAQIKGVDKGIDNGEYSQGLVGIAEGAVGSISEQLNRIKELSVRASNGVFGSDDRQIFQNEINQLKESINDIVSNTKYNGQKLLDGSFVNKNSATGADGNGLKISIDNISLEKLGIANLNVTEDFDMKKIDDAIKTVSGVRSSLGAISNRLDTSVTYNNVYKENTQESRSRIADSDIAKEMTKLKNQQILEQFKLGMQKKEQEDEKTKLNLIL